MKPPTVIFLSVVVACAMAASYVTRLIVALRTARMTVADKHLLRQWVNLARDYPHMQTLPSRADAVRRWARMAAEEYQIHSRKWHVLTSIIESAAPPGLSPAELELIRRVAWSGFHSGAWDTRNSYKVTWKDVLKGSVPPKDRRPSECLKFHFLDAYPHEPLERETLYRDALPRPEDVVAYRDVLERLAKDRELVELIDQCWQIGYKAGCPLFDEL